MDNPQANIHEKENHEEAKIRKEAKIRENERPPKPVRTLPATFGFRPLWTIVVLVLLLLLLLYLFWFYGLGSGGGKTLPGSSSSPDVLVETPVEEPKPKESRDKPSVHRELSISFIPSESDAETAKELTCVLSWTGAETGSHETRLVSENNMADFEFDLEKKIRVWYGTVPNSIKQDSFIVTIHMVPFPGEGTFQKMTKIVHQINPKISILRIEE